VKLTVPPGTVGFEEVSVTVAVHCVEAPTTTEEGIQLTDVDVGKAPYTPLISGTPVMLKPLGSKRLFKPLLLVTVSGFPDKPR